MFIQVVTWILVVLGIIMLLVLVFAPIFWLYFYIKTKRIKKKIPEDVKKEVERLKNVQEKQADELRREYKELRLYTGQVDRKSEGNGRTAESSRAADSDTEQHTGDGQQPDIPLQSPSEAGTDKHNTKRNWRKFT